MALALVAACAAEVWHCGWVCFLLYIFLLDLLNAEQAHNRSVLPLLQAEANRFAKTAALFQALGGGWRNCSELADTQPRCAALTTLA